jgi:alpha-N-acetylglucosaminidase
MAVGLNYYLKYYCHTFVSWYQDDPVDLPARMPMVPAEIRRTARVRDRFFLNYCTFGYTMPWWQWKDWERLIDWMALNGINMPLSITGEEAIWYKVWKKLGLNDQQIRSYFTGPAYLPWNRMANIDGWEGPLPASWLRNQFYLEKKIVARERELDMTPVLPAFAGHVPAAIKERFPGAKITTLGSWGGFSKKYESSFLDPFDPLFKEIQKSFLEAESEAFGRSHIYGADPFNEVTPPSWDPDYLAKVSKAIYASIADHDSSAVWLQMSWMFYIGRDKWTNQRIKSFLRAVPQDKMALLDYYGENTEVWKLTSSFFGQPYLWCYLGNFGGNTMMAGNLREVDERMDYVMSHGGKNLIGVGATLEAFGVNPIMYDYVFEKVWSPGQPGVGDWVDHWAEMRGGLNSDDVKEAWSLLLKTAYTEPALLGQATLTNAMPTLEGSGNWTTNPKTGYRNTDLLKAWGLLLKGGDHTNSAYLYDITNVGRQVLGNYFTALRDSFNSSYHKKDLAGMKRDGKKMMDLFDDMDRLLATQSSLLLGKWLHDARLMGNTAGEKNYYEKDARSIITLWGGDQHSLNDYANRSWAGLTKSYYKMRWHMFIDAVVASVENNVPFDEKAFKRRIYAYEDDWVKQHQQFRDDPVGNSFEISKQLFNKYAKAIGGRGGKQN